MMAHKTTVILLAGAGAVSLAIAAIYFLTKKKKKVYVKTAKVKKLYIHPIKSMKGIEVRELKCVSMGVEANGYFDRSFMLVTNENILVSLREEPSLIHIDVSFSGKELVLSHSSLEPLKIIAKDHVSPDDKIITCRVHKNYVEGIECGDAIAAWFQKYLKRSDIRLVQFLPELGGRKYKYQDPNFVKATKNHKIAFQDESAVHLLSESSVNELNEKLEEKVSVLNFRPSIYVEECSAFEEDDWQFIRFESGAEITTVYPCGRCVLTTVNPKDGIKTNKEPLYTLRKFRVAKDQNLAKDMNYSPCFGIICVVDKLGIIRVGDDVSAVVKKGQFCISEK